MVKPKIVFMPVRIHWIPRQKRRKFDPGKSSSRNILIKPVLLVDSNLGTAEFMSVISVIHAV